MANDCYFEMEVVGHKDSVDEFVRILKYESKSNIYFSRIFDADVYDEEKYGVRKKAYISGYCAWSVLCCMMDGAGTYYNDWVGSIGDTGRSNIIIEARRLNLQIEILSTEPGMAFCEHVAVDRGNVLVNDTGQYTCYFVDDYHTYQELVDDLADGDANKLPEDLDEDMFNTLKEDGAYYEHIELSMESMFPVKPNHMHINPYLSYLNNEPTEESDLHYMCTVVNPTPMCTILQGG